MFTPTFERLWEIQGRFYQDRPLMWARNSDALGLMDRIGLEIAECREKIAECASHAGINECVNLLSQDIREEVVDLLHFTLCLARAIGMDSQMLLSDSIEKFAKNSGRYMAIDYQDIYANFEDQEQKSRIEDKRRGYSTQFYQTQ